MKTDPKTTAARAFVRSLNILLKFARLYGYDHARTVEQLNIAWDELRTAVPEGAETSLLLGATGSQLLLDGVPLEGSPAERQFAQLLSAAGLASVQFTADVTELEMARFIHAFPTGKAKPSELALQLKTAIADARGIRVNEICFVATDSRLKDASMAAQIAAASLGDEQDQFRKMLNDPQKLLELIAAAQGSQSDGQGGGGDGSGAGGSGGGGTLIGNSGAVLGGVASCGSGTENGYAGRMGARPGLATAGQSGPGSSASAHAAKNAHAGEPDDEEIYRILRALTSFGKLGVGDNPAGAAVEFQQQVTQLPGRAQDTLRNALAGIAEQGRHAKLDKDVLIQLAEHLSIRFALERFERGEVKVNAVRQMLDRMNQEVESL
ncbi:MAG TPA: hypothetical protein VKH45_06300, partial [Candidatus Acidoferrum sp.]|nr:hypothetical protein [Candidatus Acidoferrum sp.]